MNAFMNNIMLIAWIDKWRESENRIGTSEIQSNI